MSITPTTLKNYYKNNCTDLVVLNMNQINNSSESNMLVTTERTIEIINQINNSSESNMLVTTERIQEIRSLIDEIRESWNQTEKITKKIFRNYIPSYLMKMNCDH